MRRKMAALALLCGAVLAHAQDGRADRDILLGRMAKVRGRVLMDSIPVTTAQVDALLARARAATKATGGVLLLEEALFIADSLRDPPRERDVFLALSRQYEAAGRAGDAVLALRAGHHLKDSLAAVEQERAAAAGEQRIGEEQRERLALEAQHEALKADHAVLQRTLDRWRNFLVIAGAAIALLLCGLIWALVRIARLGRRKADPAPAPVPADGAPAPPRVNVLRPPAPATEVHPPADPEAAALLALFHKRMPERVQALQDARARGDHDKVLRVLASMRPQLAQQDPEHLAALQARLSAAGPNVLDGAHQADLDALITGVERALAKR